jgi:hypothetical protein
MANATITALTTGTTTQENNNAVVTFNLSSALTSSTTVKASVTPQGGATTADYSGFQYHMGTGVGGWLTVPGDGMITLNAGFTDFQLRVSVTNDTITEGYDSLAFTVAQTASSAGLENSWWVPSLVNLLDAVGTGAAATARSITAGATVNGVEGSATRASTTFNLSGSGATYASTEVRVTMYGLGGATAADYTGNFQYNVGAGWTDVVGDLITVPGNVASFQLGILIATDSLTESTEGISFNAAQTAASVGLVNSWWVPATVNLQDAPGTGAVALPRTITAVTPTATAVEGSATAATATFNVSGGNTGDYANTQVRVSMYGLGGATAVDYTGVFSYKLAGGILTAVPGDGLITIPSTITSFQLSMAIATDALTESSEAISFNVAQTTSSLGLVDSWWVPSTVNLQDAQGTGASALPRTITTSSPTTIGMEGSTVPATATFAVSYDPLDLSIDTNDYASSQVRVSMYGLGGAAPVDYTGDFQYRIGTSGTWVTVPGNGLITIPNTATAFQLSMLVATDTISETGEGISFNVAQTTSSLGLVDSWWVPKTVNIEDVTSIYTTVTGSVGPDHFTATANPDMFVIPHGTSKAAADGATGLIAGDIAAFVSGESFDTITGFTAGTDKIDLPITVTSLSAVTIAGSPANEEALIAALNAPLFTFALGTGVIGTYSLAPGGPPANVYFFADTSGDGWWTPGLDTFVKIIGGASVTTTDFV